jgi:hypothetical protein
MKIDSYTKPFKMYRKKMDEPQAKRTKKSDKAKRTFDLHGGKSAKHIRLQEAIQAKKNGSKQK